jgi:hypothetical protein
MEGNPENLVQIFELSWLASFPIFFFSEADVTQAQYSSTAAAEMSSE